MSNALALAGVTAVLRDLLNEGVINNDLAAKVGTVKVTALAPDLVKPTATDGSQLNLFLYRVSANQGWRNEALPSRDPSGNRLTNPPLALDLHYLLSAHGKEPFHAEILLGYAMQLLHETPALPRERIRVCLGGTPPVDGSDVLPGGYPLLAAADLAEQVEQLKITPEFLGAEDLSRLWTACSTSLRLSASYLVSVVLIESRRPARRALPVRERNLVVQPLARPVLHEVDPQIVAPGGALRIAGTNLAGAGTRVNVGGTLVTPSSAAESELTVGVPAGLTAGVLTIQVVHEVAFGTPSDPHRAWESNVLPFMLIPVISGVSASVARGAALTLTVDPPVTATQDVRLIVGELSLELPARAPASPPLAALSFAVPADFPTGTFLVRLRVAGAESALAVESDAVQPDPLKKAFTGPRVTIT